jgi:hypothetical protein
MKKENDNAVQYWFPKDMLPAIDSTLKILNERHSEFTTFTRSSFATWCMLYVINEVGVPQGVPLPSRLDEWYYLRRLYPDDEIGAAEDDSRFESVRSSVVAENACFAPRARSSRRKSLATRMAAAHMLPSSHAASVVGRWHDDIRTALWPVHR